MPLFEYICNDCAKRFTFLTGVVANNSEPACPRCGSGQLTKLISRVRRGRGDDERMDALAERLDRRDLDDEVSVRRLAREMGREIGAETGEDVSEELEALIASGDEGGAGHAGLPGMGAGDDGNIY